jgi:hypothetical protein
MAREMALKEIIIHRHILDADGRNVLSDLDHPVDHQERVAMRYRVHNARYI